VHSIITPSCQCQHVRDRCISDFQQLYYFVVTASPLCIWFCLLAHHTTCVHVFMFLYTTWWQSLHIFIHIYTPLHTAGGL